MVYPLPLPVPSLRLLVPLRQGQLALPLEYTQISAPTAAEALLRRLRSNLPSRICSIPGPEVQLSTFSTVPHDCATVS